MKWTNPLTAPTNVPKVSLGNGLLYAYTKDASPPLDDRWYFTAIDVRSGETVWRKETGNGIQWNNHYAAIYLGPDGAAYLATVAGLMRFQDSWRCNGVAGGPERPQNRAFRRAATPPGEMFAIMAALSPARRRHGRRRIPRPWKVQIR